MIARQHLFGPPHRRVVVATPLELDGGTVAFWDAAGHVLDIEEQRYAKLDDSILDISEDGNRLLLTKRQRSGRRRTTTLRVLDRARDQLHTVFVWNRLSFSFMDMSDDGEKVTFISASTGDEEVYLADLSKRTMLNVSSATGDEDRPCLSRDGTGVLFESDRDRDTEIYLADIEVTQGRRGSADVPRVCGRSLIDPPLPLSSLAALDDASTHRSGARQILCRVL